MKKTFAIIIVALLALSGLAFAGVMGGPVNQPWLGESSTPPFGIISMGPFNGVSNSTANDMGFPVGYGKCTFTQVNGSASRVFILQGSPVSNTAGFTNDVSHTVSADQTTWGFFFSGDPNEWWRGRCDSGCAVGNELSVQCTFGGMSR